MSWPEILLLAILLPWVFLVWCPARTRTLWLGGLLARETAHVGAAVTPIGLILGTTASSPAWFAPTIGVLGFLLAWPLAASLASPRARPDFSAWPSGPREAIAEPRAPGSERRIADGASGVAGACRQGPARLVRAVARTDGAAVPTAAGFAALCGFSRPGGVRVTTHCYRADPVPLHLDHYRAAAPAAGRRSWLMVVHGGAWYSGSRRENAGFNRALARLGVDVLAVDYRLAPTWRYPDPLEDLADAVAWIRDRASQLELDPGSGHLLGRSAGGQLALQLAYGPAAGPIRLVVALYAPADMVHAGTAPFDRRLLDAQAVLKDYLGATWAECPAHYEAASPLRAVRPGVPPTLLLHGVDDALVGIEHTWRLRRALEQAKVPVATGILPWMQHGGDVLAVGPSAWLCFRAVAAAIARVSPEAFGAPGTAGSRA